MSQAFEVFDRLENCLKERMTFFRTPALAMALTDRDGLVHLTTLGYADMQAQIPLEPEHQFAIGSIGKSFTAMAILQAHEAGLLDLNAPVVEYLPWFEVKSAYPPIRLTHLLTHSSGLPRGIDFSPDPRSEIYAMRDQETGFAPGAHFSYSDAGYKLLGLVLEVVTGRPYAEVIREKILDPLEMRNTFAVTTSELRPGMAVGYRDLYDDRPAHHSHPLVPAHWVETNSGDGCIVSTAEDMAKFARMLLNKGQGPHSQVMTLASYQKMTRPMIEDEGDAYSYGMYIFEEEGFTIAGHGGDVPGYESYLWLDLDHKLGAIVLMAQPYTRRASFLALEYFQAVTRGQTVPELPKLPDFTHVANPQEYAGAYCTSNCTLSFEAEGHHLLLCYQNLRLVLEERMKDCFYVNHPDWDRFLFSFSRSPEGQVAEVTYGPMWFTNKHYHGPIEFDTPAEWSAFAGHYRSHNPWVTNFRVFVRKGQLILCEPTGEEEILVPLGGNLFRIGEDEFVPERIAFDQLAGGQALRATRSGCPYYRFFME